MENTLTARIRHIVNAFRYALKGIKAAWISEFAFRVELIFASVLVPTAFFIGRTAAEQLILAGSCLLVLLTELLNSAVEAVTDRIGSEQHPLSGQAKDLGAAAVLLSLIIAALCWSVILWQYLK